MKKTYTIYGNCQGKGLSKTLDLYDEFRKEYEYIEIDLVQNIDTEDIVAIRERILPNVDLFIYQPVSSNYKNQSIYGSESMLKCLKKGSKFISFPSCYFKGYFPELITIKDRDSHNINVGFDANKEKRVYTFVHDINIVLGYLKGLDVKEIAYNYSDHNFYTEEFINNIFKETIKQLSYRETAHHTDIKISDYIQENYKSTRLFHTFNHPTSEILVYIAECILERLDISKSKRTEVNNLDFLDNVCFPIYTSVYQKLCLNFPNTLELKFEDNAFKPEQFIKSYFHKYNNLPRSILENAAESYLNKFGNNKLKAEKANINIDTTLNGSNKWIKKEEFQKNNLAKSDLIANAKIYFDKGNKLYEEKNLESIFNYKKAIKLKPDYIQALLQLIRIYETQKNWSEAAKYCRQVLVFEPKRHDVYIRLGRALAKQNKIYAAIAAYTEAIELKPDSPASVYRTYGDLLLQVNNNNLDAIAAYQKAAEIKSDWGASFYNKFANLLEKQKKLAEATTYYLKALSLQGKNPRQYFMVANIYFKQGLLQEAAGNYQRALELDPNFCNAYKRLGDLLKEKNQLDDATKCYQKAIEIRPDFKVAYRSLGELLMGQGKQSEAEVCFQQAN